MTAQTSERNQSLPSGATVSSSTAPRVLVLLTGNLTGGGAERMVLSLCCSLAQENCSVHLAFPQSDDWQTFQHWCLKQQVEGWSLAADPSVQIQKVQKGRSQSELKRSTLHYIHKRGHSGQKGKN